MTNKPTYSGIFIGGSNAGKFGSYETPMIKIPIRHPLSHDLGITSHVEPLSYSLDIYHFKHLVARQGEKPITGFVLEGLSEWEAVLEVFKFYRNNAQSILNKDEDD